MALRTAPPCLLSPRIRRLQYSLLRCSVTNPFHPISNLPSPPVAKPPRTSHEPADTAAPGSGSLRLTEAHAFYSPKTTTFRRKRPNPTPSQSRFRRICHVRAPGKDRYYLAAPFLLLGLVVPNPTRTLLDLSSAPPALARPSPLPQSTAHPGSCCSLEGARSGREAWMRR